MVSVCCHAQADGAEGAGTTPTPNVVVTLIVSTQIDGRFAGIHNGQLSLATESGVVRHAIDELGELRFLNPSAAPQNDRDAVVLFFLADGGRLTGELLGTVSVGDDGTDKTLVGKPPVAPGGSKASLLARIDAIGTVELPFTALAGVRFDYNANHPDAESLLTTGLAERSTEHDLLINVRDGRVTTASGTLMSLSAEGGVFRLAGRDRPFRTDAVYAILLAAGIGSSNPTAWSTRPCHPSAHVTLADGSSFGGMLQDGGRDELVIDTSFGRRLSVSIERVTQVRFSSDRIVYLSDLEPRATGSEGITQPPWPVRMDRSASNGVIRLAGREYDKGIGMHARAWIDFDAGAAFTDLLVTIGIDDAVRPGGEAVFRVLGDDRTLYDSGIVTGRDAPLPIRIDIRGVRSLRLMADYGQELDLGAHANWANARLLRPASSGVDVSAITDPSPIAG